MSAPPTAPSPPPPAPGSAAGILLGLFLTLLGLFLVSAVFPADVAAHAGLTAAAAGGVFAVWLGGILLGRGRRGFLGFRRRR